MNYALAIGISHYQKRPLEGAAEDAEQFSDWLKKHQLVDDTRIKVLTSTDKNKLAMQEDIDLAILEILKDAAIHKEEKNRFYFYFSGHGIGVTYHNTGLCLRLWQSDLPNFNISSRAYQESLINKGLFDEILIFLDCCRDYDLLIEPKSPNFSTAYVGQRDTNVLICYSTVFGKKSYEIARVADTELTEDASKKRGAFTSFLLDGLRGDADIDGDGFISGEDLTTHIKDNFKSYALKHGKDQDADVMVSAGGLRINICKVEKNERAYNYSITFRRRSNISLYDGDNVPVENGVGINVVEGQTLDIQLPKGLIKIVDNVSKEEKYFTNYNLNTLTLEQF
ncbi:caspase family protein [Flavitalea sp.]|nr:caspase family protein [Flavitalea sp.]